MADEEDVSQINHKGSIPCIYQHHFLSIKVRAKEHTKLMSFVRFLEAVDVGTGTQGLLKVTQPLLGLARPGRRDRGVAPLVPVVRWSRVTGRS